MQGRVFQPSIRVRYSLQPASPPPARLTKWISRRRENSTSLTCAHLSFFILQKKKKAVRLKTFFIKFSDLVTFVIATFTYKFHNQLLPSVFQSFFTKLNTVHSYNTRHSAKTVLLSSQSKNKLWKIRFQGPKIWNHFY